MANTENSKLKLLRILDILREHTDENHALNATEIKKLLAQYDIVPDPKSIRRDLQILENDYGLEIGQNPNGSKYLISRPFEVSELKLLVDAVIACKFITKEEVSDLVEKIEQLGSVHQRKQLHRQVVVTDRAKEKAGSFYAIDEIHRSIDENLQLTFKYMKWNAEGELVPRHEGKVYRVSPAFLVWDNELYYLVAYDEDSEQTRHYRVDKIVGAQAIDEPRSVQAVKIRQKEYTTNLFGMFDGQAKRVTLRATEDMAGIFIDRFGKEAVKKKSDGVRVSVEVKLSQQFYGWLTGLGPKVQLIAPAEAVEGYKRFLDDITANYQ